MFKFIITRITDTDLHARWAYLIDDSIGCKWFLKHKYDIDIEEKHYGQWLVCTDDACNAWWTCQPDKFARYYRIIDVVKEEKTVTDFHGDIPTCAGTHTGECICSTEEHTTGIKIPDCPANICVSYSKEHGFFMSVNFTDDNEE